MSILHYPGMVLALLFLSFFGGMIALYVRLPHALWRLAVALARHSYRLASRLGQVARHVRTATQRRSHAAPRPPARSALRVTFPAAPWRTRPRLVVLVADPSARRARADQLRDALADLLRARSRPLPATLTVEVASEARRHGIAYVAYLDRGPATGTIRIRLAAFAPDGAAIGVDAQHTHLADLLPYLDDDPAATFVGLPAADPPRPPSAARRCPRAQTRRSGRLRAMAVRSSSRPRPHPPLRTHRRVEPGVPPSAWGIPNPHRSASSAKPIPTFPTAITTPPRRDDTAEGRASPLIPVRE